MKKGLKEIPSYNNPVLRIILIVLILAAAVSIGLILIFKTDVNRSNTKSKQSIDSNGSSSAAISNNQTGSVLQSGSSGMTSSNIPIGAVVYTNTQYGFNFSLPADWKGYTIVTSVWDGTISTDSSDQTVTTGQMISIRNPQWTQENQMQDIPIMIFTVSQWNSLQKGDFYVSAAPDEPTELGSNSKYVFAQPVRYYDAFPPGVDEVLNIMQQNPLTPIN